MWVASPPRLLRIALCALALVVAAGDARACAVRLGPIVSSPIAYDPFALGSANGSLGISVDLADGDTCDTIIALTNAGGSPLREFRFDSGGRSIALRGELRETAAVHGTGSPDSVRVHLSPDTPHADLLWRLVSSEDGVVPPGDIPLDIVAAPTLSSGSTVPSRGTLILRSVARAQANLAGVVGTFDSGSQAQTIDFGILTTGAQRRVFLQVRANVLAHLSFSSEHRGSLVNEGDARYRVGYQLAFDGVALDLSAPQQREVTAPLSIAGTAFPIDVTIGDVRGAMAGRYSDTVSIEVSP
ncbi:hypothetical protein [Sphingomonas sp. PAMC 26605]|uniref:hypothetical protein n=1 Tax=Sphingomonas sp. PAMC 26605 TaxID=1112214 RepID=UPI00026CA6D9|nr:hypothetical protein [Sphingomonas sp. PAMC 26605]